LTATLQSKRRRSSSKLREGTQSEERNVVPPLGQCHSCPREGGRARGKDGRSLVTFLSSSLSPSSDRSEKEEQSGGIAHVLKEQEHRYTWGYGAVRNARSETCTSKGKGSAKQQPPESKKQRFNSRAELRTKELIERKGDRDTFKFNLRRRSAVT